MASFATFRRAFDIRNGVEVARCSRPRKAGSAARGRFSVMQSSLRKARKRMRKKNLVAAAATTVAIMLAISAPAMAQGVDFDDGRLDHEVSYNFDEDELLYLGYYPYLGYEIDYDFDEVDFDDNEFDEFDDRDAIFVGFDDFDRNDRQENRQDRRDDRQDDRNNNGGNGNNNSRR